MANMRSCYCCSTEYEYCTRCLKFDNQPKWRFMFDTEECKELFNVISGYNMGVCNKEDVKKIVDKYNITDYSKYNKKIADVLNELFPIVVEQTYVKRNKKSKKAYVEAVVDVALDSEVTESVEDEVVISE